MVGTCKGTIQKRNEDKLVAHMRDAKRYKRYLLAFKKTFSNFIYKIIDNLDPFNPTKEVGDVEYNGMA
jgi:hypothetical protein